MLQLSANHLRFGYLPGQTVLHDVSLTIKAGETLYILGRNGSGKTTLLACLAGLLVPDSGTVTLNDKELHNYRADARAQRIGLIPQLHTQTFGYTVGEMVLMGRTPHLSWLESPSQEDHAIAEDALAQVGIFELRDRPFTAISGGEQQLALIARGLVQKSQILLMDEPTAHLDLSNQHRILEIITQLTAQGLSFVIASHSPNNALAYADRVLLLSGGWVTAYGPPQKTLTEPLLSAVYGVGTEIIYDNENGTKIPRAVVPRRPAKLPPDSLQDPDSLLSKVFRESSASPQLILVTGLSGAGKTIWCKELIQVARDQGWTVRGVLSPSIFSNQRKTGITIQNLGNGETRQLARLRKGGRTGPGTPRWTFDSEVLAWANQVLADFEPADLLVIDELGPMEFLKGEGLTAGLTQIDSGNYRVAVVVVRSSLLPAALQRWPHALVVSGHMLETYKTPED